MIYNITIIISTLVALNFVLLVFSSNKVKKVKKKEMAVKRPQLVVKKSNKSNSKSSNQQVPTHLSPTGS